MKRFLIGLTVALLFLCLTLGAAAEEALFAPDPSSEAGDASTAPASETDAGVAADAEAGKNAEGGEVPDQSAPLGDETVRETAGGRIVAFFEAHIGEIFSALTLVGSLVLMCGYKRGFLPALCRGLDCVTRSTEQLGERAVEMSEETKGRLGTFLDTATPLFERAEQILTVAEALRERATELEKQLSEAAGDRAREETLWRGVADLLYGVFTAANLPDYAKEQLGKRYAALLAVASPKEATDAGTGV